MKDFNEVPWWKPESAGTEIDRIKDVIDRDYLNRCIEMEKVIIIFYSRNCYHYTKCDSDNYFIEDKKK